MWTPSSKITDRLGRRIRLYAGQKNTLVGGRWFDIAATRELTHSNGTFRLKFLGEHINFTLVGSRDLVKRTVVEGSIFGHVFNASTRPDSVEYRVTGSRGMNRTETGWQIADGVGIDLRDWFEKFPGKVDLRDDKVILDLTGAQPDEFGEINLDPETVPVSKISRWFKKLDRTAVPQTGWELVLDAPSTSNGPENALFIRAQITEDNIDPDLDDYFNFRSGLRFDTSAVHNVLLVELKMNQLDSNGVDVDPYVVFVGDDGFDDLASAITPMANYKIIKDTGFDNGARTPAQLTLSGSTWTSASLRADWVRTTKFDLGLYCNFHDGPNAAPTGRNNPGTTPVVINDQQWTPTGGDAPFLEITPNPSGAALLLMD